MAEAEPKATLIAPELPSYLTIEYSHFSTEMKLRDLMDELVKAFIECGIVFKNKTLFIWNCTWSPNDKVSCSFEVAIFSKLDSHLVELRLLNGCRLTFSEVLEKLSDFLHMEIPGKDFWRNFRPLPFP